MTSHLNVDGEKDGILCCDIASNLMIYNNINNLKMKNIFIFFGQYYLFIQYIAKYFKQTGDMMKFLCHHTNIVR